MYCKIHKSYCFLIRVLLVSLCAFVFFRAISQPVTMAQNPQWEILSPLAGAIVENENLLVSVMLNNYEPSPDATIFLDNTPLPGTLKISGNKISFVYFGFLRDGLHRLTINSPVDQHNKTESYSWNFYVNQKDTGPLDRPVTERNEKLTVSGSLMADNRSTSLSGSGQKFRQEPAYTRSVSLVMDAKFKNSEIPVRIFATSDNRFTQQSNNYFQVGYHNKWMEMDLGDLNPNFDRLVLSGVRVSGASLKFKFGKSNVQMIYGDLVRQPIEGLLENYIPGAGFLPGTFISDSQYVVPGVYKRWITGARAEFGFRKENLKIGITGIKAKDKLGSIKYGLLPKDNLVGGVDLMMKLIKKSVTINANLASSALTNDISGGIFDREKFLEVFGTTTSIDPARYKDLLIINPTTIPGDYRYLKDGLAFYSQLNYSNKFQSFNAEYRSVGALYNSLGNPFLRNNYKGISVSEKFNIYQRKLIFNINYQHYKNNTNQGLQSTINSNILNAGFVISPHPRWPIVVLNYMMQDRKSSNEVKQAYALNDQLHNYLINVSYRKSFWGIDHNFRAFVNLNKRKDKIHPLGGLNYFNYMVGLNEGITSAFSIIADYGQTIIKNNQSDRLSGINTYSLFAEWQIHPQKVNTSLGISNNQVMSAIFSPQSYRLSAIFRVGYQFYRSMALDLEMGYSPYKEKLKEINDYVEQYVYLRYLYNFDFR